MNSKAFEYFMKLLRKNTIVLNYHKCITKPVPFTSSYKYSTTSSKSIDILDFYVDLISQKSKKAGAELSSVPLENKTLPNDPLITSKVDRIISDMSITNPHITSKMLAKQLTVSLENMDFSEISKIIDFCIDKQIPLPSSLLSVIASKYSNSGLLEGLVSLQTLCKLTDVEEYHQNAEFLHYLAYCYWICGNSTKCVEFLRECCDKYPDLNDVTKRVTKMIVSQVVRSQSQAQLIIVIKFVKEFTYRFTDYYLLTALWNDLFLSEWFADQQLADELLSTNEELQKCISFLVPTLVPYLLGKNKIDDIYRFLPILLKYNHLEQYAVALQILFDHFCALGDKSRCGEIVSSSSMLKTPLRDEQYKQYISWTCFGSPLRYVKEQEIRNMHKSL